MSRFDITFLCSCLYWNDIIIVSFFFNFAINIRNYVSKILLLPQRGSFVTVKNIFETKNV